MLIDYPTCAYTFCYDHTTTTKIWQQRYELIKYFLFFFFVKTDKCRILVNQLVAISSSDHFLVFKNCHTFSESHGECTDSDREEVSILERKTCICYTSGRRPKNEERGANEAICRYKGTNWKDQWGDFWIQPCQQCGDEFINAGWTGLLIKKDHWISDTSSHSPKGEGIQIMWWNGSWNPLWLLASWYGLPSVRLILGVLKVS